MLELDQQPEPDNGQQCKDQSESDRLRPLEGCLVHRCRHDRILVVSLRSFHGRPLFG